MSLDLRDIPDIPDIPQIVSSPRTPATAPDEDAAAEAELDAMYAAFGTGGA